MMGESIGLGSAADGEINISQLVYKIGSQRYKITGYASELRAAALELRVAELERRLNSLPAQKLADREGPFILGMNGLVGDRE